MQTEFTLDQNKNKRKTAPVWYVYLLALCYLAGCISAAAGLYCIINRKHSCFIFCLAVVSAVLCIAIISSYIFDWYKGGIVKVADKEIEYVYDDVLSFFGHSKVIIRIQAVSRLKYRKRCIVVYGRCKVKEPAGKWRKAEKIKLYGIFENHVALKRMLESRKGSI